MKILIVEDEPLVAMLTETRLLKNGYEVAGICASGEEAINEAEKLIPDLVIMDIFLEGRMDGIEATAHLNKHLDIPVIYLTGNTDIKTFDRARETRHYGYYEKPLSAAEFSKAVKETFELIKFQQDSTKVKQ